MKNFYPNCCNQIDKRFLLFWFVFVFFGMFGLVSQAQIATTTPASRCGEGAVVLHATTGSGTIKWYTVPFYGTAIADGVSTDGTTFTTPTLVVSTTYYVDAVEADGCSLNTGNTRVPVTATISASSIQASIFYSSTTFCNSVSDPQAVTRTGTAGGSFSYTGTGTLSLDPSTGAIIPSASDNGTYTVTYTVVAAEGCIENPASTTVTITTAPVEPAISYTGSPFCTTAGPVTVTQTGATGGTYSASPSGLTIDSNSGTITPASSLGGTYTITYNVSGAGGCLPLNTTATVAILQLPTASIAYGSASYTQNQGSQSVSLSGTGAYTGGVYSSSEGLTIDSETGSIDPTSSDAGNYAITYSLSAVSPCAAPTPATTAVTIYPLPTASISGSTNVCLNATEPEITFTGANGQEPYTFTYNINGGPSLTISTTPGSSVTVSQATSNLGTFIYNLISVSDSYGSNQLQSGSATVLVNETPVALFSYPDSPYCSNGADPLPTFLDGGTAGTFTSTSGLVFLSDATGEVDLSASTPGTYTVTNTIAAANGCSEVVATSNITITQLPDATFSYTGSPYCASSFTANPTVVDAGVFTANDPFVVFSNTSGQIDLVATPAGTYTITNTVIAVNGCSEVSQTTSITILNAPTVTTEREFAICNGTSPNIGLTSNPEGASFTWTVESVTGGITGASSSSGLTIDQVLTNPSNSVPGIVNYSVTPTLAGGGACAVGQPFTISVTVNPTPALSSTLTPDAICSGAIFDYTPTSDAATPTFAWTRDLVAGISEAAVTDGTGSVSETLTNTTNAPIDVTYQYITTSAGCSNSEQDVVVTVNPKPTITDMVTTICSTEIFTVTPENVTNGIVPAGTTYTWDDPVIEPVGAITGGSAEASGQTNVSQTLTNITNAVATATYTVTPLSGSCSGSTFTVTATVNPLPEAPTAGNVTVTYDGSAHTATATAPEGSTVVWYDAATEGNVTVAPVGTNAGTYTAWAESLVTLTGCKSATRTLVAVDITAATITELAITGITAPVAGATPVTTATNTVQYTATVAWSGSPVTFASGTVYTATITITPTANYTLTGMGANTFTVAGATSVTHSAGSGVVTVVFPGTVPDAPTGAASQSFCSGI